MTLALSRRSLIGAATIGTAVALGTGRAMAKTAAEESVFGPAAGVALLSRNENPYGPAPSAIKAMAEAASKGCYYVDKGYDRLKAMVAEKFGVTQEQVVIGNGSTEILSAIALAWKDKGAVLCPELFWDKTVRYGERKGAKVKRVALKPDMSVDLDAMAAAVGPDIGLIQICNPNNPTGMVLDGDTLRGFIRKVGTGTTILIDEAYNELTAKPEYTSVVDLVKEFPNLIICRTFSKIYGMAGLRVGYSISSPENAELIGSYLMGFGGNAAGLAAAIASFNDTAFTSFSKNRVTEAREMILEAVKKAGLTALPSECNFLFVKVPDADALRKAMADKQIMIRGAYGKWTNWSRVSTGKIEDVKRYAAALPAYFNV